MLVITARHNDSRNDQATWCVTCITAHLHFVGSHWCNPFTCITAHSRSHWCNPSGCSGKHAVFLQRMSTMAPPLARLTILTSCSAELYSRVLVRERVRHKQSCLHVWSRTAHCRTLAELHCSSRVRRLKPSWCAWRRRVYTRARFQQCEEKCRAAMRLSRVRCGWRGWDVVVAAARTKQRKLHAATCVRLRAFVRVWTSRYMAGVKVMRVVDRWCLKAVGDMFKMWEQRTREGRVRRTLLRRIHDMWSGRNVWQSLHMWRDAAYARKAVNVFMRRCRCRGRMRMWRLWREGVASCAERSRGKAALTSSSWVRVLRTAKYWKGSRVYVKTARKLLRACVSGWAHMVARATLHKDACRGANKRCCIRGLAQWRANAFMAWSTSKLMRRTLMQWITQALR
jgi:hypothetical protein